MKAKSKMHALAMLLVAILLTSASVMGSVQDVFAKTIEFKIDLGENKKTSGNTSTGKTNTVTASKKGSVAGISYDKLAMANVTEAVNVRSEASENGKLIGKLYRDCGGTILEQKSGWTKIKTGELTGWVKDDYLVFGDEAAKLASSVVEKTAVSKTSSLRVRKEPNTDSEVLSLLGEGDTIEAVSEDGEWVKVEFSDGDIGYVSAEYVSVEDKIGEGETIESINAKEAAQKKEKAEAEAAERKSKQVLTESAGATNNGAITGDVNDTALLAALIQAEGGNQPYEGQVSIGTVVMNRLRSGRYGNTIYSVIYAKSQFGPAGSGQVARIYAAGPKASCMQAAADAMSGVSYIGNATHFRNVSSGYSGVVIGSHVFW
ncbi:MAG: SH3 domain-containing protein [Lachnospiraceae bacterium]|nr:SH3 domain-containing protein [Lachnospiraceae bacterium]